MKLNRRSNQLLMISFMQIRTFLVLALLFAYIFPYLVQGYTVRKLFGVKLNAWGTFACTLSNAKVLWVCFTGYLLMLSDLPCFSAMHIYESVRSKGREITAVRIWMVLKMTLLYVSMLFFLFCLMSGSTDFSFNEWDRLHFSYSQGQLVDGIYLDAPPEIILDYTPIAAFGVCASLCLLVFACFGLCLLFLTMLLPMKKLILALCCAWGGFDMAIDEMGFGYRMYAFSPLSAIRLHILEAQASNMYYPSKIRILVAVIMLFAILLMSCVFFPINRRMNRLCRR